MVASLIDQGFSDGSDTSQSLAEMLLAPMHRMSSYEWTLQELLRLTPTDHVCREDMQKAVMQISQLNMMLLVQKKQVRRPSLASHSVLFTAMFRQASRAQILADSADIHPHLLQVMDGG